MSVDKLSVLEITMAKSPSTLKGATWIVLDYYYMASN